MKDRIRQSIDFANAAATLLRTTALTLGPPLLRMVGDREGQAFAGLVTEKDVAAAEASPLSALHRSANAPAIELICANCRGQNVSVEAKAVWNARQQAWTCSDIDPDSAYCEHCGRHTSLQERVMTR